MEYSGLTTVVGPIGRLQRVECRAASNVGLQDSRNNRSRSFGCCSGSKLVDNYQEQTNLSCAFSEAELSNCGIFHLKLTSLLKWISSENTNG